MYCFIDESGNTGLELFDANQPILYYGLLSAQINLDVVAEPLLKTLRKHLGVELLHANELGVGKLTEIASPLTEFSKKRDLRFSLLQVVKPDHSIICFFDQVFDSGMNKAVPWHHYFTPLRYVLLFKVSFLFDEELAKEAWVARRERNPARCAEQLVAICKTLLGRIDLLPDARSQEIISGALRWAIAKPFEISYGVGNLDSELHISPNLIGFQQVLQTICEESSSRVKTVRQIVVDRQSQFNKAQAELAGWYEKLRKAKHNAEMGPGMPSFDYSGMPEVPPTFKPGDASAGLELVDITLWIAKRRKEGKPLSTELEKLFFTQAKRGRVDEVSLAGLDRRWRHLVDLPEPDKLIPENLAEHIQKLEEKRKAEVEALGPL